MYHHNTQYDEHHNSSAPIEFKLTPAWLQLYLDSHKVDSTHYAPLIEAYSSRMSLQQTLQLKIRLFSVYKTEFKYLASMTFCCL